MGRLVVAVRAGEAAVSATEPRYVCIDQKCKKLGTPGLQHVSEACRGRVHGPPETLCLSLLRDGARAGEPPVSEGSGADLRER